MRQLPLIALILAHLALCGGAGPAAAPQDTEDWPSLFLMADHLIDVSQAGVYEMALKDVIVELGRHKFPFRFDTYVTDDSHYYLIHGLKGFADVDRWLEAWEKLGPAMGRDIFQALQGRLVAAELERTYRLWRFRTDISFLPVKERLKPEEIGFYTWDFVWLVPGAETEFEALNKEWIALSQARGARDPFLTYAGELGADGPVYCWFEYGKTAADYALAEERFWKSLGEAGADLSRRTRALIRRQASKTGRYRLDLSYAPPS